MPLSLGFDTSNYKTSVAFFDGNSGQNLGKLLEVPQGSLGLRQSDALFQHVKRLPEIADELLRDAKEAFITVVGASTRPRAVEGSYMPCFLAGESSARVLASAQKLPFYPCSHQQGHIAAAAWSAGAMDLLDRPHLAWHLSGGTTELTYVEPDGVLVNARQIGGSSDIAAGQLLDRTGQALGFAFPSGAAVDALALQAEEIRPYPVKVKACAFSLSGIENQMRAKIEAGERPENICRFVLNCVIYAVQRASEQAQALYPGLPVLYAGGVASSGLMRQAVDKGDAVYFAEPAFSADNAMGVAILAWRQWEQNRKENEKL